jgi:periplasmic divalent cation tolerance protein
MAETIQVMTTTPTREEAAKIAAALLETRLAACVQVAGPVEATTVEGGMERSTEWLCISRRGGRLRGREEPRANHSYEVPEIIACPSRRAANHTGCFRAENAE